MINFKEINPENWRLGLKVSEAQRKFVSDDMRLLARAYAYREQRSRALVIYNDDCPVGMALYHDCEPLKAFDLSQLFIDERYQGNGYGMEASRRLIEMMKADGKYNKIVLCYVEGNESAKRMYEKLGFAETDRDGDEIIMELKI